MGYINTINNPKPLKETEMKYLVLLLTLLALSPAHAGNCDYADDRAADGSRCGKRSADSRF